MPRFATLSHADVDKIYNYLRSRARDVAEHPQPPHIGGGNAAN